MLSRSVREKAAEDDEFLIIVDGRAELKSKPMYPNEEGEMSLIDWIAAAETVEEMTLQCHGVARADPLKAHHWNVLVITRSYGWGPARFYDKRTREHMASDPRHNPSVLNHSLVIEASTVHGLERAKASLLTQQFQFPQHTAFPGPIPPPLNVTPTQPPSKRFTPYDPSNRPQKPAKSNRK